MKLSINEIGVHGLAVAKFPEIGELSIVRMPAFGAWPMTGGERRRLVEEEEFGVGVRPHDHAVSATELGHARDPAPQR